MKKNTSDQGGKNLHSWSVGFGDVPPHSRQFQFVDIMCVMFFNTDMYASFGPSWAELNSSAVFDHSRLTLDCSNVAH